MAKIGLYLCKCGGTISDNVKFSSIIEAAKKINNVKNISEYDFFCSQDGLNIITEDITSGLVDRVVIVACSPKLHSKTFESICEKTSLNKFMIHMVNIREQCIWMTKDKEQATEKIIKMIKAGAAKALYLQNIEQKEIEVNPDVLVIGAGIAGVEAALLLSEQKRKVYLIDKEPAFGGTLPKLEHTYPSMECAPCILAPRMKELADNKKINLMHYTQVENVVGFGGNFKITLRQKTSSVIADNCISCMACIEVCPVEVPNSFNSNLNNKKAIDFYFPGSHPKAPYIDRDYCMRWTTELECTRCKKACAFEAIDYELKDEIVNIDVGSVIIATGSTSYDISKVYPELLNKVEADSKSIINLQDLAKYIDENSSIKIIDERSGLDISSDAKILIQKTAREELNIFDGITFERILSTTGPTKGKLVLKDGTIPKSIAIVHCAGSRSHEHLPYCSGICCKYALKHSHQIKERLPECEIVHLYNELCLDGLETQNIYEELQNKGVLFKKVKMDKNGIAEIKQQAEKLLVTGETDVGKKEKFVVDMIILANGILPNSDLKKLSEMFNITMDKGYLAVEHKKISAVSTIAEGVYVVGTAGGPKDVTQTVIEARSAVGELSSTYIEGKKLALEPMISFIDENLCEGCRICINLCPYKAIIFDEDKKISFINEVLCRGCGTCAAACPSGAIEAKNYTYKQLLSEIKGALHE